MAKVIPYKETIQGPQRIDRFREQDMHFVPRVGETMIVPDSTDDSTAIYSVTRVVHNFQTGSVMVIGRELPGSWRIDRFASPSTS